METTFSTLQVCSKLSASWDAGHSVLEPGKFQANQDDELVTYRLVVRMKREKCMKSPEHGGLEKSGDGWGPMCTALHSLHNTSTLLFHEPPKDPTYTSYYKGEKTEAREKQAAYLGSDRVQTGPA